MQQIAQVGKGNWSDSWPGTTKEGVDEKVDMIEAYEMMNGVCEDEDRKNMQDVNVKIPEIYPPKRNVRCNEVQSIFCVNNRSTLSGQHNVNSDQTYISTELANLIYNKVEKNEVIGIETIQYELCRLEEKYLQVEKLDEIQK